MQFRNAYIYYKITRVYYYSIHAAKTQDHRFAIKFVNAIWIKTSFPTTDDLESFEDFSLMPEKQTDSICIYGVLVLSLIYGRRYGSLCDCRSSQLGVFLQNQWMLRPVTLIEISSVI